MHIRARVSAGWAGAATVCFAIVDTPYRPANYRVTRPSLAAPLRPFYSLRRPVYYGGGVSRRRWTSSAWVVLRRALIDRVDRIVASYRAEIAHLLRGIQRRQEEWIETAVEFSASPAARWRVIKSRCPRGVGGLTTSASQILSRRDDADVRDVVPMRASLPRGRPLSVDITWVCVPWARLDHA